MLICIAGKNNIAVDVLEYLYNNEICELGITCNKTETGIDSWQRSLRLAATRLGVKEYLLNELYDIEELIFLSLEYDRIIRPELFRTTRLYNIHFSLLPKYKGMYTSAAPILNGDQFTGVTLHKIDCGIDTGDIIAQKRFKIMNNYNCRDVYLQLIKTGTDLVIEKLDDILVDRVIASPQPWERSTYYSKKYIDYSDLKIDINQTALGIQNQIRAFTFREYQMPRVKGYYIVGSKIMTIRSKMSPGAVIFENNIIMVLATVDYNIILYKDRFSELLLACEIGNIDAVKDICSSGFHINDLNEKGCTPLMVATYNNQKEVVYYLLSIGADINAVNYKGENLLMYAKDSFVNTGDGTLISLFLKLGLSPKKKDYQGKDFLDCITTEELSEEQRAYLLQLATDITFPLNGGEK